MVRGQRGWFYAFGEFGGNTLQFNTLEREPLRMAEGMGNHGSGGIVVSRA